MRTIIVSILAAAAMAIGIAVPASASSSSHQPATWLRFGPIQHYTRCHGIGQVIWQQGQTPEANGTSALHCRNGHTYTS